MQRALPFLLSVWTVLAPAGPADTDTPADNRPPQVLALNVMPSAPTLGESVRLRVFGEDPDGDALRWIWTVDGESQPAETPELVLTAPAAGEYTVRAVADDGRGGRAESELRFKVFQRTWCDEAAVFHDDATLTAFYTGAPSLTFERQTLIDAFLQVLRDSRAAGSTPIAGQDANGRALAGLPDAGPADARASAIQTRARERAAGLGRGLTPAELFAIALEESGGNVRDALLAGYSAVSAQGPDADRFREQLAPLRDRRGYSREQALRVRDVRSGAWQFVSAAETAGGDQQGAWATLFGTAALALADRHGDLPFRLLGREAALATPDPGSWLRKPPTSPAGFCSLLSDYALRLQQHASRRDEGRAPDPDRSCIAYGGAALGVALRRELDGADPATSPLPAPTALPGAPTGSYAIRSPLSIELFGVEGQRVGFESRTGRYTGTTPNAIVDLDAAADGTLTVVITPLFAVREIVLSGAAEGRSSFGAADLEAGFSRVWTLPVTPSATYRYIPAYALTDADGAVVDHAAELRHDRVWAFPQAPMLIIGMTSALGLLLGLVWVWRRGPFRAPPALPPGADPAQDRCNGCGATTRPGARFCRQCGRQLR